MERCLANALAAALDQKAKHNDEECASNYPDKCRISHVNPPFLYLLSCVKD